MRVKWDRVFELQPRNACFRRFFGEDSFKNALDKIQSYKEEKQCPYNPCHSFATGLPWLWRALLPSTDIVGYVSTRSVREQIETSRGKCNE
jgi:hypothetical protein